IGFGGNLCRRRRPAPGISLAYRRRRGMTAHGGKDRAYYQHSRTGELTLSEVTADLQNNVGRIAQGLHFGNALPEHREQTLLQFRPYEIPRLSLRHTRGCCEDVSVRIDQTGQGRLALAVDHHAASSRRCRDLGDLAAIDDNGGFFDLFLACENADVRDDQIVLRVCGNGKPGKRESYNQCAVHCFTSWKTWRLNCLSRSTASY